MPRDYANKYMVQHTAYCAKGGCGCGAQHLAAAHVLGRYILRGVVADMTTTNHKQERQLDWTCCELDGEMRDIRCSTQGTVRYNRGWVIPVPYQTLTAVSHSGTAVRCRFVPTPFEQHGSAPRSLPLVPDYPVAAHSRACLYGTIPSSFDTYICTV